MTIALWTRNNPRGESACFVCVGVWPGPIRVVPASPPSDHVGDRDAGWLPADRAWRSVIGALGTISCLIVFFQIFTSSTFYLAAIAAWNDAFPFPNRTVKRVCVNELRDRTCIVEARLCLRSVARQNASAY